MKEDVVQYHGGKVDHVLRINYRISSGRETRMANDLDVQKQRRPQ